MKIHLYLIYLLTAFVILTSFFDWNKSHFTENNNALPRPKEAVFINAISTKWADSLMRNMSLEEKIGQLFMVAAYSNKGNNHFEDLTRLVTENKIGGLIFFQGNPHNQALITNKLQRLTKVPLYISIDGEWGLAMRLDSTHKFPKQMTMGAVNDNQLIYEMGKLMAKQCKRLGVHINFAPVADVNNNSANPVINYRSFGEDKYLVTEKCLAYMKGMQDNGIMANAKHFPGHGDTDTDSHLALPLVNHTRARLDSIELYPFRHLIDSGLGSVMVAHMNVPSLDNAPNRATTLSKKVVVDLLQTELNFKGLIFTDALNMKGVSSFYEPGIVDVEALKAGNDVLLFAENVPKAIEEIKKAMNKGIISLKDIEGHCRKILMAKRWSGLNKSKSINLTNLTSDLNDVSSKLLNKKIYAEALTLIKNKNKILPLKGLATKNIAILEIGSKTPTTFSKTTNLYCRNNTFNFLLTESTDSAAIAKAIETLRPYNCLIVNINNLSQRVGKNFGYNNTIDSFIQQLYQSNRSIIINFPGNPYALKNSKALEVADAVLIGYEENVDVMHLSAQVLFGGIGVKGKLPVTINESYKNGSGIKLKEKIRFNYPTSYEEVGLSEKDFSTIDSIINKAIKDTVFPGCQILAAKNGQVFYYKSFGFHTYDSSSKRVENSDIYDLASITKIASSTAALMKLQSEGLINVDSTLANYVKDIVDSTDYAKLKLKEMLCHQAGLVSWIPFYIKTMNKGTHKPEFYATTKSDKYNWRVAENLYITSSYRDTIFKRIVTTKLGTKKYLYSDLGYYFMNEIIQRISKKTQDVYMDENFYKPLGLSNIGYKPREKWDVSRIPPTENDKTFRKQLIHADVHDQGSAMMNGIAGHAGLFSNANDLAVMMQLFLQYGEYGGERYFSEETGKLFTSSPYYKTSTKNRRGIGFDKAVQGGGDGPTCIGCSSSKSFGHSGFTGTITWADPENGFVYVFLSNRVYTDAENRKIIKEGIRSKIQFQLLKAANKIK